jgi:hypothetical protein
MHHGDSLQAEVIDVGQIVIIGVFYQHVREFDFDAVDILSRYVKRHFAPLPSLLVDAEHLTYLFRQSRREGRQTGLKYASSQSATGVFR